MNQDRRGTGSSKPDWASSVCAPCYGSFQKMLKEATAEELEALGLRRIDNSSQAPSNASGDIPIQNGEESPSDTVCVLDVHQTGATHARIASAPEIQQVETHVATAPGVVFQETQLPTNDAAINNSGGATSDVPALQLSSSKTESDFLRKQQFGTTTSGAIFEANKEEAASSEKGSANKVNLKKVQSVVDPLLATSGNESRIDDQYEIQEEEVQTEQHNGESNGNNEHRMDHGYHHYEDVPEERSPSAEQRILQEEVVDVRENANNEDYFMDMDDPEIEQNALDEDADNTDATRRRFSPVPPVEQHDVLRRLNQPFDDEAGPLPSSSRGENRNQEDNRQSDDDRVVSIPGPSGGRTTNGGKNSRGAHGVPKKSENKKNPEKRSRMSAGNARDAKKIKTGVKQEEEVVRDPVETEEDQIKEIKTTKFYLIQCLGSYYEPNSLSIEKRAYLDNLIQSVLEKDVSEEIPYEPDQNYISMAERMRVYFDRMMEYNPDDLVVGANQNVVKKSKRKGHNWTNSGRTKAVFRTPIQLLATKFKLDLNSTSGTTIVNELASQWSETHANMVYDSDSFKLVPNQIGPKITPTRFFGKIGFPAGADVEGKTILPVVVIDKNVTIGDEFKNQVTNLGICIVRGFDEKDFDYFNIDNIAKIYGNKKINVLLQRAQHSSCNENIVPQSHQWEMDIHKEEWSFSKFVGIYKKSQEDAKNAFNKFATSSSKNFDVTIKEIQNDLIKFQLVSSSMAAKEYPYVYFGTNVDLMFNDELRKVLNNFLDEFLIPQNKLMKHMKKSLAGINEVQMYFKYPGSRTPGHQENQAAGSININLGGGECVWYVVAMEHSSMMETLMFKKSVWPYHTNFWPTAEDLEEAGIPYQRIIQKKGDLIYVGVGSWHWVQSNGFCTNVAWNVMQEDYTQIAAAAIFHDHNAEHKRRTLIPLVPFFWNLAEKKVMEGTDSSRLIKSVLARSLAKSKFEYDFILKANNQKVPISNSEINFPDIVCCWNKDCPRDTILTVVCIQYNHTYCVNCVNLKNEFECYMKHTFEDLIKIYDSYN